MFRPAGLLATPVAPTSHLSMSGSRGFYIRAYQGSLPHPAADMHVLTQSKNNVAALELMRHLGVCYKTAWLIKHKLMEVMRVREDGRQLDGRVEVDDAYLGGERSGGKTGRGSENKVPFVAAVQTTPDGQPQFVCLRQQPLTHEEVAVFAPRSIAPSATVISDGLWCFGAVQIVGADHERVVTGGGRASTKLAQFKAINTYLGNLKRSRVARITPSTSPSTPIATSPRPSTDSTVASICAPSWPACCAPPAFQLQPRRTSFVGLRLVANQVGTWLSY